jgi:hypothetical protein
LPRAAWPRDIAAGHAESGRDALGIGLGYELGSEGAEMAKTPESTCARPSALPAIFSYRLMDRARRTQIEAGQTLFLQVTLEMAATGSTKVF